MKATVPMLQNRQHSYPLLLHVRFAHQCIGRGWLCCPLKIIVGTAHPWSPVSMRNGECRSAPAKPPYGGLARRPLRPGRGFAGSRPTPAKFQGLTKNA